MPEAFPGIHGKLTVEEHDAVVRVFNDCLLTLSSAFFNLEDGLYELEEALGQVLYGSAKTPRTNLESYFS